LIPPGGDEFWAPEVAYHDGIFYMYYSAHGIDGRDHQLRVATSTSPLGPFRDAGRLLVPDQPFTIDAHPFLDRDGRWYLFYSQDFLTLDGEYRVGTGIVVDRMLDLLTLAGEPRVVVRPHADWQLFKSQRSMYGAVYDWHTVEGPAVRLHNERYYCFYSGGAWEHDNYGVSYVVAEQAMGPYYLPDGIEPVLLRSVPGHLIGPGHNSFTESQGSQEYIIYHAWDPGMTARRMCIDKFTWQGDKPVVHGPTWTPQPIA
jgi:GH43 family beta-xylosidase